MLQLLIFIKIYICLIQTSPIEPVILSTSPEPFSNIAPGQQLLEQGEVVRASGKYNKPTKIQGKNYFKDEVVIRNADSGKGKLIYIKCFVLTLFLSTNSHYNF